MSSTALAQTVQPQSIPGFDRPVRYEGLMRCCVATLDECAAPTRPGAVLICKYESRTDGPDTHAMVVAADGTWERHVLPTEPIEQADAA